MDDNTLALLEKICDHVGLDVQELSSLCENQERNQLVTQSNDKIYKPWKKKNKWYIRVKRDGKMLYYSYDTELRAKRAYQQALEDANIEKLTVKQALGEYQAHQRRLNKKTSALTTTYRLYAWLESILHVPILAVTEQALIEIYKARAQCVAGATSRNELAQVKTFFKFCEKHKYVKQCPAAGITPDYSPRARRGKKALRPGEAAILVKSLLEEDTPAARALLLQIGTGLRSGELCALQVRDIDALTRTVWIDSSKSDSGKRQVRIPDPYWDTIYRQVQGRQPLEFAFAGHAGKPHWPDWLRPSAAHSVSS